VQAEDGIRDDLVTGVQTCALPILAFLPCAHFGSMGLSHGLFTGKKHATIRTPPSARAVRLWARIHARTRLLTCQAALSHTSKSRSEERRVGTDCGDTGWPWRRLAR